MVGGESHSRGLRQLNRGGLSGADRPPWWWHLLILIFYLIRIFNYTINIIASLFYIGLVKFLIPLNICSFGFSPYKNKSHF